MGKTGMKHVLAATMGLILLAGCARVDDTAMSRFKSGDSTSTEVIAALGKPDRNEVLADGSRMLTYIGSRAHTRIANFAPVAGYIWGGWNVDSEEANLMFSPDDKLRFFTFSSKVSPRMRAVGSDTAPVTLIEHQSQPLEPDKPSVPALPAD
ncbi:conserved exported hypothetical protein [Candidatus Terasakiella magnetica]|nr:conserved exported hypothetical protein [Candidatus Terasakiella magnetica]